MPTLAPRRSRQDTDEAVQTPLPADRRKGKLSRQTKIVLAVVGSLLLHVVLIVVLAWVLPHWPRKPLKAGNAPFHFSVVRSDDKKEEQTAVPANRAAPYIRTPDQAEQKKPDKPDFISSNDTTAASEKAAEANQPPLPSQDGRDLHTYDFDTHLWRPGKEAADAATAASAPSQENSSTPNQTPVPTRKTTAQNSKTKTNPRSAAATPTPAPDGELATVKAQPTPLNEPPRPEETPSDTPPPPTAHQSTQAPSRANTASSVSSTGLPKPPGYQPQTIQSKMSGSVSNRGKPMPGAIATPLGRYEKAVQDAIGSMWYMQVEQQMSFLVHTSEVKLHFYVTRSGRVRSIRVSGGDANNALASLSIGAVNDAQIMPIPPEVAAMLPDGELEVDMGFSLFLQ